MGGRRPGGGEDITPGPGPGLSTPSIWGVVWAEVSLDSGWGELGLVATMMSSMASGLRGLGVLAPLLASVLQLSSLRARPRPW